MPSPYRRRRVVWTILLLGAATLFYMGLFTTSDSFFGWSLPSYLKDIGASSSGSRVSKVANAKAELEAGASDSKLNVQEIHGLLHFVTAYPDRRFDEEDGVIDVVGMGAIQVDPMEAIDLRVYSPEGDDNWASHLQTLKTEYPLVVFSKTYCPYSQKAKVLLSSLQISPKPYIVEIDQRTDGAIVQSILARLTGRKTVPNILVQAESIGGSDDILALHEKQQLIPLLEERGLKVADV